MRSLIIALLLFTGCAHESWIDRQARETADPGRALELHKAYNRQGIPQATQDRWREEEHANDQRALDELLTPSRPAFCYAGPSWAAVCR